MTAVEVKILLITFASPPSGLSSWRDVALYHRGSSQLPAVSKHLISPNISTFNASRLATLHGHVSATGTFLLLLRHPLLQERQARHSRGVIHLGNSEPDSGDKAQH